ncbi:hypothetical protein [Enterobacter cloacae complex sp. 2022EL-00747]|uniref:hypothetical protein n=1 Tax=Enterobacter cloacae complex sp. 2022EL-00747 TaxID=2998100 RepID=UPI00226F8C56|nr:hypothetical protein [Enterobacter cloacae complex sp. 2022EL-00747]MCY0807445.1 hypothetical protein [Enterobacter cloacae complex sp. 2022EL-00747]
MVRNPPDLLVVLYLSLLLIWLLVTACVCRDGGGHGCAKYFSSASSRCAPQTHASRGSLFFSAYEIPRRRLRKKSRNHTSPRMAHSFPFCDDLPAIAQKLKSLKSVSHISVWDLVQKPQRWRGLALCFVPPEKLKSFSTRKPQAGAV